MEFRFQVAPAYALARPPEKLARYSSYSLHVSLLIMIACRSPGSILMSEPNGYGALLLSDGWLK